MSDSPPSATLRHICRTLRLSHHFSMPMHRPRYPVQCCFHISQVSRFWSHSHALYPTRAMALTLYLAFILFLKSRAFISICDTNSRSSSSIFSFWAIAHILSKCSISSLPSNLIVKLIACVVFTYFSSVGCLISCKTFSAVSNSFIRSSLCRS
jgi:hypothetical protein